MKLLNEICSNCSGSGVGRFGPVDDSKCTLCNGTGEVAEPIAGCDDCGNFDFRNHYCEELGMKIERDIMTDGISLYCPLPEFEPTEEEV